jgi:fatty-acid desaturase
VRLAITACARVPRLCRWWHASPFAVGLSGFFWAHMGWLMHPDHFLPIPNNVVAYFRKRPELWLCDVFAVDVFTGMMRSLPFPSHTIILAFCLSLHAESLINSYCHEWTANGSCVGVDVRWVALVNAGEGWHGYHHKEPSCAYHGHGSSGFDLTYTVICALERLGLVHGVCHPRSKATSAASKPSKAAKLE